MDKPAKKKNWVWVIIERDGDQESLFGQFDQQRNKSFIPVFNNKEDGLSCLGRMAKKPACDYQVQAMRLSEVSRAAAENYFQILLLGKEGEILERISSA